MDESKLRINGARLRASLEEMARIGATPAGGMQRLALSDEDKRARDLFVKWLKELDLSVSVDEMGNIFGRRAGRNDSLPPVMAGSHIDSQPRGGRFDGILGVMGALEVMRTLHENKVETERELIIVDWTNEEGSRFAPAMGASGVWAGALVRDWVYARSDKDGKKQGEELARIGYQGEAPAQKWPTHAYYELHIEQGPMLERQKKTIGAPKGIVCLHWYDVYLTGEANQVGPTPMEGRHDALAAAAEMILAVNALPVRMKGDMVATVGEIQNGPNSRNIIADKVHFTVDIRSWDDAHAIAAWELLKKELNAIAVRRGTSVRIEETWRCPHAPFAERLVQRVLDTSKRLGYSHLRMVSGAGHDASYMNQVCPTAMIFVPSIGGRSHVEVENTSWEDCQAGANVLLHCLLATANEMENPSASKESPMKTQELQKLDRAHVIYSWKQQGGWLPTMIDRAEGVYMYDTDGRKILDGCSGLLNINIGHSNRHVLDAMKAQMEKLCFVSPGFGTEPKAKLASMVAELTPGDLDYVLFTNGGADANENAIKSARWFTGRHKIYGAWKSYHGATGAAITVTGDPRRWPAEPGMPGVVHFFGPYPYRCPFGSKDDEECGQKTLAVLKEQLMYDDPRSVAAIIIEPVVGTNGIIVPPKSYMKGLRQLCDENGILLIVDEVMAGWGRAGKWFAIEHFDVVPDIITTAKGITSGYVQLGATIWSKKIWEHFQERKFTSGLTYCGHALACACGIANIEVYKKDNLIEKAAKDGEYLARKLKELEKKHPSVGDTRCLGLWACIELVADKKTKAPLAGFGDSIRNVSGQLSNIFMENGLYLYCNWDYIFISPPLTITRQQIDEMVAVIEKGLDWTDTLAKKN